MHTGKRHVIILSIFMIWLAVVISGCGSSAVTQSGPTAQQTATVKPAGKTPVATTTNSKHLPIRIQIPAIKVDAEIEPVSISKEDGNLDTPQKNKWEGTGWYKNGIYPGEQGSAVIDGHLDRPGGAPAVFWDLNKLKIGDDVFVINTAGKKLHFKVTQASQYPPDSAPLQSIFGDNSGRFLNLITCAGVWDSAKNQTTLRMVVYTTLV